MAPSAEYLRGHGRVAVDVTALRRLWQHSPVLGLVILACVPVYAVLRGSLLCNSCGLSAVKINEELIIIDTVSNWAKRWQMEFNVSKCTVIHYGEGNIGHKYTMDQPIEEVNSEKDLPSRSLLT